MSLRRFCDLCEAEIASSERFYDVILNVKVDQHGDDAIATYYRDFCYTCTKSGKALTDLMARYEASRRSTGNCPPPGGLSGSPDGGD